MRNRKILTMNYYAKNKNGSNFNHIQEKFQEPERTIINKKNGKIILRQWKKDQKKMDESR